MKNHSISYYGTCHSENVTSVQCETVPACERQRTMLNFFLEEKCESECWTKSRYSENILNKMNNYLLCINCHVPVEALFDCWRANHRRRCGRQGGKGHTLCCETPLRHWPQRLRSGIIIMIIRIIIIIFIISVIIITYDEEEHESICEMCHTLYSLNPVFGFLHYSSSQNDIRDEVRVPGWTRQNNTPINE